ncbi:MULTISPECIES: hypothetical protein [Fusobacterium]|uniref:Uncharacterized protein n=1 Tax=Fusobacterium nucleatum subsp. polymorphum TaxID=76857 RepID=A0A241Q3B3_FUSNP|nr:MULTISPECIES: hypothetical protein [Fusobacterium]ASG29089.1 hypothetical protein CBG61_09445 [Fusobacterium polymorphum]WRL71814.1 hypothetical protein VKN81_05250 [Fusobacterium polymorphum]WRL74810.1 hypothetical protein VKN80_09450 [Fusobacterium polymorphum]
MSRANLGVFEANLLAILEAINELVHLELLIDTEFAANVNFLSLRNLASNELFFTAFINEEGLWNYLEKY